MTHTPVLLQALSGSMPFLMIPGLYIAWMLIGIPVSMYYIMKYVRKRLPKNDNAIYVFIFILAFLKVVVFLSVIYFGAQVGLSSIIN